MSALYSLDENPASGQKVLLATTAYDSPDASYTASITCSRAALADAGIGSAYALLSGNCHVDDARNSIIAHFLRSDCTDLVFLDADVSWQPDALVRLCGHDVDIVGGVYPKRTEGAADMPVRMIKGAEPDADGLLEVEGLPTGFLRIKRGVVEALARISDRCYMGDDATEEMPLLFQRGKLGNAKRLGGDIGFCMLARKHGFECFADTTLTLGHTGKVTITGSLAAWLRKHKGETLKYVASQIGAGHISPDLIQEARDYIANPFAAGCDGLLAAVSILKERPGPVIETGSGISSVLMAAAVRGAGHYVYSLEHDPVYAEILKRTARDAGVKNIGLVGARIDPETGWYNLKDADGIKDKRFVLGFIDGPPRVYGSRTKAISHIAPLCDVLVVDDMEDPDYQRAWIDYAERRNRQIAIQGRIAIVK